MPLVKRVALIGPAEREELQRLAIRIEERGGEAVILDSREDPAIELGPDGERACGIDLGGVCGLYVADLGIRPYAVKTDDGDIDREASRLALAASRRHLVAWNALLTRLSGRAVVVNPPVTHALHGLKAWEAAAYARQGLPVPHTVATGEPGRLLALEPPVPGAGWIRKGLIGGLGYTEPFERPADPAAAETLLAGGPVLVQERIEGGNLRAYVVEREIVGTAEIFSASGDEIDSRRNLKRLRPLRLPPEAEAAVIAAATRWGMSFAAVDLMYDGRRQRWVLLECNSAPFFVTFERLTGIAVSARLAEHLLRGRAS
jgi:glutathione synthase/RimK-type ligase-like ATP-grasp enzyme